MRWFTLVATFVFLLNTKVSIAQNKGKTITGQISAADTQYPVEGATVQVKGTKNISGSQEDGIYFIVVLPSDSTLVFKHPEYEPREIRLTHETEYNVLLKKRQH